MEAKKKTALLALFGVGALLLVNYAGEVSDTIDGLRIKAGYGGLPKITGLTSITFPVKVTVANYGTATLPLNGLSMTLSRYKTDGSAVAIAATDPAGVVTPNIKARAITTFDVEVHTDILSVLTEVIGMIQTRGLGRYRLDISIISAGVRVVLPAQDITY